MTFAFIKDPHLQILLSLLKNASIEARFVGGCARNALMNLPLNDIDMAVNAPPHEVMAILQKSGYTVIPTGIDHGTITVIVNHQPIEMTALRHDVETDGRRAVVAFTDDWEADAQRRDFTVNAVYVDGAGAIYDYVGALEDLKGRRIRFIGDPATRIAEDALRILRFFRFSAAYAKGPFDAEGLRACGLLKENLHPISRERKGQELFKLWTSPRAIEAWQHMEALGILDVLFGVSFSSHAYVKLAQWEDDHQIPPDPLRVCAALPLTVSELGKAMVLSNAQKKIITFLKNTPMPLDQDALFEPLYRYGKELVRSGLILALADTPLLSYVDGFEKPPFPITGQDMLSLGIEPGPIMGDILRRTEDWWISQKGRPSSEECIQFIQKNKN